jgi:fumarate hydratase class II
MLPVIAYNLLQSIEILANGSRHLAQAVESFSVNSEVIARDLARNPILVTALNPLIGYARAAEIAKAAVQQNRPILDVAVEMTDIDADELRELLNPANLLKNSQ